MTPTPPDSTIAPDRTPAVNALGRPRPAVRVADNACFRLLVPLGFAFCATALAYVMSAAFGDQRSPVNRAIGRAAPLLLALEAAAVLLVGVLAMAIDRRRTRRALREYRAREQNL